jgi:transposase-like protein
MPRAQQIARILSERLGSRDDFANEFGIADMQLYAAIRKAFEKACFNTRGQSDARAALRSLEARAVRRRRPTRDGWLAPSGSWPDSCRRRARLLRVQKSGSFCFSARGARRPVNMHPAFAHALRVSRGDLAI